jgi:hypothetical protein
VTDTGSSGSDPIGDFQRWLMRSSARSLSRELKGQARRTFGGGSGRDVWEAATAEPIPDEAPECAWCPVCRAARRLRQSGPGLASHVAGAGDALLTVAQDTLSAFEATLSARPPEAGHESQAGRESPAGPPRHAESSEGTGWPDEAPPRPARATTETAAGAAEAGEGQSAEPDGPDRRS